MSIFILAISCLTMSNLPHEFRSVAQSCPTLCDPMDCSTPGLPVHQQLPKFTQTHVHWISDAIQPSHPLSSPSPPAFNLAQHPGLSNESLLHIRWPKYWSFSFNISPSNDYPGLISFRMDCLDLLVVQGTLKSLLQGAVLRWWRHSRGDHFAPTNSSKDHLNTEQIPQNSFWTLAEDTRHPERQPTVFKKR